MVTHQPGFLKIAILIILACITTAVAEYNITVDTTTFFRLNALTPVTAWLPPGGDHPQEALTSTPNASLAVLSGGAPTIFNFTSMTTTIYLIATRASNRGQFGWADEVGQWAFMTDEYYPGSEGKFLCVAALSDLDGTDLNVSFVNQGTTDFPWFGFGYVVYTQSGGEVLPCAF